MRLRTSISILQHIWLKTRTIILLRSFLHYPIMFIVHIVIISISVLFRILETRYTLILLRLFFNQNPKISLHKINIYTIYYKFITKDRD